MPLSEAVPAPTPEIEYLHKHMFNTYFVLRKGMACTAIVFPLLLWWVGAWADIDLQGSMSAYYHTSMRNWFVGLLFAVGGMLYLYKGFSMRENVALNLAGLFA